MGDQLVIDPKTSALLVMDFQTAIVEMAAGDAAALLARTAISSRRRAGRACESSTWSSGSARGIRR